MSFPAEYQFAAVVILIYLVDCLVLLHVNEAVVERTRGGMRILFGSQEPWIARRRVLLLAPWKPLVTAWRVAWSVRETLEPPDRSAEARALVEARARLIARLAPWTCAAALLVLVATPAALVFASIPVFVLVAALAWLAVWALVLRLALLRRALDLPWSAFALLAFECVACPPVAANLPRRLSLRLSPAIDLTAFVDDATRRTVHRRIARELDARLSFLEPDAAAYRRAEAYRDRLLETAADPRGQET